VRLIVSVATGEEVQRINYDDFGNITNVLSQNEFTNFTYACGLYDNDTKLIRFGARDYDAVTGRWTSKDPILFGGVVSNLYEYCLNDPINNIDYSGLQKLEIIKDLINIGDKLWGSYKKVKGINKLIDFYTNITPNELTKYQIEIIKSFSVKILIRKIF
jgi:RHS repeat-associated protein